jgi:hypothetical protein
MKHRRSLFIAGGLMVAIILAFYLKDVIRQAVVTPLAYLWWALGLVFSLIPQAVLWVILLAVLFLIIIASLLKWNSPGVKYEVLSRPAKGAVETLAGWLLNAGEGTYYKWMVANRLAKLWREVSAGLDNRHLPGRSEEQVLPEAVRGYLKAGLEKSFVDYPLPALPFMRKQETPFDIEVDEVVEFLESFMEAGSGQKHP